jgi:two-component system CheB/CheR fusion protein
VGRAADEARGRHFLSLDIGLPVEQISGALRASLSGEAPYQELVVDARNRRGKAIRCRVTCTALVEPRGTHTRTATA